MLLNYQTLIGALVGLFGVALTLYWNARKDRSAREERERKDAQALTISLIQELKNLSEYLGDLIEPWREDWLKQAQGHDFTIPLELDVIYRANIRNIGLLPEPVVSPVVDAYVRYRRLAPTVKFLAMDGERHIECRLESSIAMVTVGCPEGAENIGSNIELLMPHFEDLRSRVDSALSALGAQTA